MQYEGKLYGKIGRKVIPLKLTSDDVDRMETALKRIANCEPQVPGLAPEFYGHAKAIAIEALKEPNRYSAKPQFGLRRQGHFAGFG